MNCYLLLFQVDEHNQQHDAENSKSKDEDAIHEESFLIGHDLWHDGIGLRFMGGFIPVRLILRSTEGSLWPWLPSCDLHRFRLGIFQQASKMKHGYQ